MNRRLRSYLIASLVLLVGVLTGNPAIITAGVSSVVAGHENVMGVVETAGFKNER